VTREPRQAICHLQNIYTVATYYLESARKITLMGAAGDAVIKATELPEELEGMTA
jgi:hypothetical protein